MPTAGATGTGLDIEDVFAMRWIGDARLSADGRRCACVETRCDDRLGGMRSRVLVIDLEDGSVTSPSPDDASDVGPRWSADGRLAFVACRGGSGVAWLSEDGREPGRPLATVDHVSELAWHPRGDRIVVACAARELAPSAALHEIETISYKVDGRPILPRAGGGIAILSMDGTSEHIAGTDATSRRPAWSPDGERLAWIAGDAAEPSSQRARLVVAAADGSAGRTLAGPRSRIDAWSWSPDSDAVAWIGHDQGSCLGHASRLSIARLDGGVRELDSTDVGALGLAVRADDLRGLGPDAALAWVRLGAQERIYCRWADGGQGRLGWLGPDGGGTVVVDGDRVALAFDIAPQAGRLAMVLADADDPGEVWTADPDGVGQRAVTERNRTWRHRVLLGVTERLEAAAPDGQALEAWLTLPPPGAASAPAPMILSIHGGPHYPVGWRFSFEHHRLAARGYAVLSGNPRGSAGYGDGFMAAVHGDWGGVDHADLLTILDTALADDRLDARRLGVTGVSYGGYMTSWSITQGRRFGAAVAENGISDLVSAFGTSHDAGALMGVEMGGLPWDRPEAYLERSPLRWADRISTPLLLLHAERDRICPIGQSEELYTALRRLGRPVSFVRARDEGHLMDILGGPDFRRARASTVDAWFDRYL